MGFTMTAIECAIFVLIFGAICAAYEFGRRGKGETLGKGVSLIHQYSPPIDVMLE